MQRYEETLWQADAGLATLLTVTLVGRPDSRLDFGDLDGVPWRD